MKTVANVVESGPYMLTHLNNVYLFGGEKNGVSSNDIMKLECEEDTIESCKFVEHEKKLQYARKGHSVIPIPDDIVAKFCEL